MCKKRRYYLAILWLFVFVAGKGQDLKLWYKQPAVKWTEALPIGNGRIGAMIFGAPDKDRIQFNEETLWTGYPRSYSRPDAYQYLDSIRQLLFEGKQKEAEAMAEQHFMGTKSNEGKKDQWISEMVSRKGIDGDPSAESYNDRNWKIMAVPSYEGWEAAGFDGLDGAVWVRHQFNLPAEWAGREMVLDLNRVRDQDYTYINGKLVGSQSNTEGRKYIVPAGILHAGINTIAVQILNFSDKGGIGGYKDTTRHIGIYPNGNEQSKLSLNGNWKYFIQSDSPPATGSYQASYQPFGDVYLNFNTGAVTHYRRELDISNAVSRTSYSFQGVNYTREYFISQPDQVMVIHLTASEKKRINFSAILNSPHRNFKIATDENGMRLDVQVRNGALKGSSYLRVINIGGTRIVKNDSVIVANADEVILYLSAATNYKNYKDVSADPLKLSMDAIKKMENKSFATVRTAHIKEYQSWFNTYSIRFFKKNSETASALPTDERLANFAKTDDPSFAALYQQYGRYLLISSSRPGTRPANLQGIWNDLLNPPWGSKYTTNINAEMNYWPAELLNLSPMHDPLFEMTRELMESGKQTAKDHYNARGWVLHHNTDLWRGTAPINAANHGIWVTGGAWLCQHLWEHYAFTLDKDFLRNKAYPIIKEASLFFVDYLVKDPVTGQLISSPSNSPEQGGLVAGPTMDHQIIRNLFSNFIAASTILNKDAELRKIIIDKKALIAPNKIGKYGQLQEWMKDTDDTTNKHRHISHLWGMYPGNEINWDDSPELMKAARQSLLYRGDAATGWSLAWKINCWARFKDGNHTFELIRMLMSPVKGGAGSYPNLFDAHPPFQIDGNFGGAAGIGEMLIQTHTKYMDILPALPDALSSGEVKGLCGRGGFVMDMNWSDGQLQKIKVLSKAGGPLLIRYKGIIKNIQTIKGKVYQFNGALQQL